MKLPDLWPPLSHIQRELECSGESLNQQLASEHLSASVYRPTAQVTVGLVDLLLPIEEIKRRRIAVQEACFPKVWAAGTLVDIELQGKWHGVLLDRPIADNSWCAWLTAPECDWAGPFDVLLEPGDEPFDPACGIVQTWNTLEVTQKPHNAVLGVLGQTRLGAIRAIHQQHKEGFIPDIPPEPGKIGLRASGSGDHVLTGTPLLADDSRLSYQRLYRRVVLAAT